MSRDLAPTIDIRRVVTPAEREVYRFRYAVVVDELKLAIEAADHRRRMVIDTEDDSGNSLAAFCEGDVVGALRVNFLRDGDVSPHRLIFGFDGMSSTEREVTSVSARFFVAARLRGSPVAIRITQAWYRFCRAQAIEWDCILVQSHLVRFYQRLGWLQASAPVRHQEIGEVVPLRLHLTDEMHLRSIRSPFVTCLDPLVRV